MASNAITPEKIKNVLSSFLVKNNQSPSRLELNSTQSASGKRSDSSEDDANSGKYNSIALRSYKNFLKRLDTFSARTWFGKPPELSPLVCARYGWENVETDMLQCCGCKVFLCGKLPPMSDREAYKKSLEKLKNNIVSSHDRICVLGSFPCPEDFCHVQVDDVASLSSSFVERATALSEIQDCLPYLFLDELEKLGYDEGQAGAYCKRHLMPDKDISPQAVTLTFLGWTCSPKNKDVLVCSKCRRKVGLWNFNTSTLSKIVQQESSESETDSQDKEQEEPKVKRRRISVPKKDKFNAVDEHNYWCPWIQHRHSSKASSQTATPQRADSEQMRSTVPAFIGALKSIAPGLMDNKTGLATEMKKSPMMEGLRCFRRALDLWSSPKANSPTKGQVAQKVSPATNQISVT